MKKELLGSPLSLIIAFHLIVCFASCKKEETNIQPASFENKSAHHSVSPKVYVSNIDQLYAAVNDFENEGKTIVLAAGTYMLNPAFPNAGRLQLLHGMSLIGEQGHPENVIIDVGLLPSSSFTVPPSPTYPVTLRTGAVRMGNGKNAIEWITLQNDPNHSIRALIQTDIVATPVTQIRIAHCIFKGSNIAIGIMNRDAVSNGRTVEAEIEENEIMDNTVLNFGCGIQLQNSQHVSDAAIRATLRRNYIHDNREGLASFNASAERSSIEIKSYSDRIIENGVGLTFNGGFCDNAAIPTLNNSIKFEAYGTQILDNVGSPAPPFLSPAGGIYGAGAEAMPGFAPPGTAHHNDLQISLHGCAIEGNAGAAQVNAFGAHSFYTLATPTGTYNTMAVYLYGQSAQTTVNFANSVPVEPAGTNTVAVYRY